MHGVGGRDADSEKRLPQPRGQSRHLTMATVWFDNAPEPHRERQCVGRRSRP